MLEQEAAGQNSINSEPSNGAMNITTTTTLPEFVTMTTMTTNTTMPEPMDQDVTVPISTPQACSVQAVQQPAAPATVTPQMFVSRAVSSAPVQSLGLPQSNTQPVVAQPAGTVQPPIVQPRPIAQPILPQANKVAPSAAIPSNKPMYLSSPSKLIAIPGNNVPRYVQGVANFSRFQLIPQNKLSSPTPLRPIAPRLATSTNVVARSQVAQIQLKPTTTRAPKQVLPNTSQQATGTVQQRVLVQARTGSTQLRAIAPNLGNIPAGATIQFPPGTIIKDGVVYVPQKTFASERSPWQQHNGNSGVHLPHHYTHAKLEKQVQPGTTASGVQLSTVQITPSVTSAVPPVNGVPEPPSPTRQRKPCNCTKSQCLKLYCDCFANGEFCSNCNCNNCSNNIEHEQERSKAIKACLERNPHAFHPKIGKGKGETERRHNKGCHCKRSGCLKNYCECYEAKILCTSICKCTGCKNFEESPERKTLMHLADAAEVRVQQQNAAKTKLESQMEDLPSRAPILAHAGEKLPFSFVTPDVVEATCRCLLVQASAAEKKNMSRTDIQKLVLEEFGNCLLKIIHAASNRSAN